MRPRGPPLLWSIKPVRSFTDQTLKSSYEINDFSLTTLIRIVQVAIASFLLIFVLCDAIGASTKSVITITKMFPNPFPTQLAADTPASFLSRVLVWQYGVVEELSDCIIAIHSGFMTVSPAIAQRKQ